MIWRVGPSVPCLFYFTLCSLTLRHHHTPVGSCGCHQRRCLCSVCFGPRCHSCELPVQLYSSNHLVERSIRMARKTNGAVKSKSTTAERLHDNSAGVSQGLQDLHDVQDLQDTQDQQDLLVTPSAPTGRVSLAFGNVSYYLPQDRCVNRYGPRPTPPSWPRPPASPGCRPALPLNMAAA